MNRNIKYSVWKMNLRVKNWQYIGFEMRVGGVVALVTLIEFCSCQFYI